MPLPLELRSNDIVRHILNIDSRFRDNPTSNTTSNFYFKLITPVKNVIRVRITSIEFPNNYYIFTAKRNNTSLYIIYNQTTRVQITIPDGNYSAYEIMAAIQANLNSIGLTWLVLSFLPNSGRFVFTGNQPFCLDMVYKSLPRPFDYGLGYYLGFSRTGHDSDTGFTVTSDHCATFSGDNYVFLKINDFDCVRQTLQDSELTALAKLVLREPKNFMSFDDYASQHVKEVVFQNPTDLSRFHIRILDSYGDVMDLASSQISFSMEVLEVRNTALYNSIRDSGSI